jgi:hypothetical protein
MGFQPFQPNAGFDDLRRNPDAAAGLTVLVGYPTTSDRGDSYRRLYFTPDLSAYVDISTQDIVTTQPLSPDVSPLGAIVVWVKRDARLHFTRTASASQQLQAGFLQGEIARAYLPQTGWAGLGAASGTGCGLVPFIVTPGCWSLGCPCFS